MSPIFGASSINLSLSVKNVYIYGKTVVAMQVRVSISDLYGYIVTF